MKQRADLTFRHNRDAGRHGWLRLTPAYSVTLVRELLSDLDVVGKSRFYDAMLPVEALYADLMRCAGLQGVSVRTIRKRSSKKELFEFVVGGVRPAPGDEISQGAFEGLLRSERSY